MILQGTDLSPTPAEDVSSSVTLDAFPFPITQGCYVTIVQEYGVPLATSQIQSVKEAQHIVIIAGISAQLHLSKTALIPPLSYLYPDWVIRYTRCLFIEIFYCSFNS